MTILEAITRTDNLKFNTFTQDDKITWLSKLDGMVYNHIIMTHDGADEAKEFTGYNADTDTSTELLVPAPYEDIYINWLDAQIDLNNGEIDKYNVSIQRFAEEYATFENFYNRIHKPIQHGKRFLF